VLVAAGVVVLVAVAYALWPRPRNVGTDELRVFDHDDKNERVWKAPRAIGGGGIGLGGPTGFLWRPPRRRRERSDLAP
jgi:hypothetical protein